MPIEVEIKYPGVDLGLVRQRLTQAGAVSSGAFLERNVVFDTPERSLLKAGCLLRVRECEGAEYSGGLLTFKSPAPGNRSSGFKRQEEWETHLTKPDTMRTILAALGYSAAFAYDKVREIHHWQGIEVCLDLLPFGDDGDAPFPVVELEGDEPVLERAARMLHLPAELASADNYHELNKAWRAARNLPCRDSFIFSEAELTEIRANLARNAGR